MKSCDKEPEVIFLDNHLLVLNKPAPMLTQPDESGALSLQDWGKKWLKDHFKKPGNVFLEAVHRIDRPTSGIVVLARTSKALQRMQENIRNGDFHKEYRALVEGHLPAKEGVMIDYLAHSSHHVKACDRTGKRSELRYFVLEERKETTLVRIELLTGRYHQIRYQFGSRGHPVWGDDKYGSSHNATAIALHHARLRTSHPVTHHGTRQPLVFEAPCEKGCSLLQLFS